MLKVCLYYLSVIVTQSYLTALKRTERRLSLHNLTYPYAKPLNLLILT